MRDYRYDAIVFLNRSQPLHKAHKKIYDRALALGKLVIPVFGSHRKAVNTYNPWTTEERLDMVMSCFDEEDLSRMRFTAVCDHPYKNRVWLGEVHSKVSEILDREYPERTGWSDYDTGTAKDLKIGIIGYKKDDTSAYLDWFPQWEFIDTASFSKGISATDIRNSFFMEMLNIPPTEHVELRNSKTFQKAVERAESYSWREHLPATVVSYLENFKTAQPERCVSLVSEYFSNLKKKAEKENYRYPIIEDTVDSVVMKNGHVLLVRRGRDPGKGQWALPGGYLGEFEEKFDAALRELNEETSINLFRHAPMSKADQYKETRKELVKCCVGNHEFGHPMRSTRGRVITRAFHFELPKGGEFPYIRAADDAAETKWFPVPEIYRLREIIFEDHLDIIEHFNWKESDDRNVG